MPRRKLSSDWLNTHVTDQGFRQILKFCLPLVQICSNFSKKQKTSYALKKNNSYIIKVEQNGTGISKNSRAIVHVNNKQYSRFDFPLQ